MGTQKETGSLSMPWEKEFGYAQGVKVGDTIYILGQFSHDHKGNLVHPRGYGGSDVTDICQYPESTCTVWRNSG